MSSSVSGKDPEAIAGQIKDMFQSMVSAREQVQLNIPRHLVTARFLKIPSISDEEIEKIMKLESIKHLPYTDESVIYGYRIVEKTADGYSKVLLSIAQAQAVNNFINILKMAGTENLKHLSLSSEALFLWYMQAMEGKEKETAMVVNLDRDHIDVDVIEKDKLVFTRGVAFDMKDSKAIDKMASEIKVSITSYQKESSNVIGRVILTGQKNECEVLKALLVKEVKVPVEIISQTENVPLGEDVEIGSENVSFAESFGLLLRPEDIKINLIPKEVHEETRFVLSKNNFITAIFLSLLLCAIIFGITVKKLHDKHIYLSVMNTELKKIEPDVVFAKKMAKDIKVIQEMMDRKPLAIDVISEVYAITPGGISLNIIDFESGKTLTVRGNAPALSEVLKYVTSIEGSPYFEGVKIKYANKRIVENREAVDFEIDAVLSKLK
ncbi:MAG: pilus assembly protein PilM [Candidatus Omnitrophota bacterium]|nr:pilus assembly protein PilM [Candidatus Omnitrophota bacterium]